MAGMASMYVQEAEALATLAPLAGKSAGVVARLKARAAAQRALIRDHLWDEARGIFVNKFWNGSFCAQGGARPRRPPARSPRALVSR